MEVLWGQAEAGNPSKTARFTQRGRKLGVLGKLGNLGELQEIMTENDLCDILEYATLRNVVSHGETKILSNNED